MRTSSRETALLLFPEVELLDVALAVSVLSRAGRNWNFRPFKIVPVAEHPGLVETRSQVRVEATRALSECPEPELVIVPGGYGARRALERPGVVAFLERARKAEVFLALGHGVLLLARAGLCADTDVAASPETAGLLSEIEPTCRTHGDDPWRRSGRIASARTAIGAAHLALDVVAQAIGDKQARLVAAEIGLEAPPSGAPEILRV